MYVCLGNYKSLAHLTHFWCVSKFQCVVFVQPVKGAPLIKQPAPRKSPYFCPFWSHKSSMVRYDSFSHAPPHYFGEILQLHVQISNILNMIILFMITVKGGQWTQEDENIHRWHEHNEPRVSDYGEESKGKDFTLSVISRSIRSLFLFCNSSKLRCIHLV